jgi:pentatricopeptide repeat protein
MMKKVLNLMNNIRPKVSHLHVSTSEPESQPALSLSAQVKPNLISYSHMIRCFAEAKKPKTALLIYHQMCRRGILPNGYVYMSVLKALVGLRDGYSAYQIIQEMRARRLEEMPDLRHYSMAIFAAVVSNRCGIADELYQQYLHSQSASSSSRQVDVAICSLHLRSLLQQGRWEEGLAYLQQMEASDRQPLDPQHIIQLSKPNDQTYSMLLQFQILDERYEEAMATFQRLYDRQPAAKGVSSRFLEDVYASLSFALGSYSSAMQQRYHQDTANEEEGASYQLAAPTGSSSSSSSLMALTGESIYYCRGKISSSSALLFWLFNEPFHHS